MATTFVRVFPHLTFRLKNYGTKEKVLGSACASHRIASYRIALHFHCIGVYTIDEPERYVYILDDPTSIISPAAV